MKFIATILTALFLSAGLLASPTWAVDAGQHDAEAVPLLQLRESFAGMADGLPPVADWVTDFSFDDAAAPVVRDGFLTTADPDHAAGGSYRIAQMGGDVTTVGAEFAFSSYTQVGGVLCLSIQATSIATDTPVPVSPVHLNVSPTEWRLDVNAEHGTGVEPISGGTFATPLASDGRTLHRVEINLDRAAGRVVLDLPDGRHVVEHPSLALPGAFVYVEPFKWPGLPLAGQANALVSSWWAATGEVQAQQPGEAIATTPAVSTLASPTTLAASALAAPSLRAKAQRDGWVRLAWNRNPAADATRVWMRKVGENRTAWTPLWADVAAPASSYRLRLKGGKVYQFKAAAVGATVSARSMVVKVRTR